jgi:hypothetical protein
LVAVGPKAKNGKPYSEDQNYTIIIGLQREFRDLVQGKAQRPLVVEQAQCLDGGTPEITVIAEAVPAPPEEPPFLQQDTCGHEATKEANANCTKIAKELKALAKGIETLAASSRVKGKRQFKLKNDTACPICFSYRRCNDYGCWDEMVRASGKSTLFAGVSAKAPTITNPQFCRSGLLLAAWRPPLPPRRPLPPPPLPARSPYVVAPEAVFLAAREKAAREGVWTLTAEDIRGLSLEQITALRGY